MARAAVFLDRDDTLIRNRTLPPPPPPAAAGDLTDPRLVELLPGALEACSLLADLGYPLFVVTNQGVVARGGISVETLEAIHDRLRTLLTRSGESLLTGVYACCYHPGGTVVPFNREHPWRKPQPGMLLAAAEEHGLDLGRSWMIGDAARDIEAAIAAGIPPHRALLIGSHPEALFTDVLGAARHIAAQTAEPSSTEDANT